MGKFHIRQQIKERHLSHDKKRCKGVANTIFEQIERMSIFANTHYIAIYHALSDEIETAEIIKRWSARGKSILLPRIEGEQMEFYAVEESELRVGSFGIVEPYGATPIDPSAIELMIIPGVAFCSDGRRLGRGKGFYDRYLARCSGSLYKIGVCFDYQIVESIPCDAHDILMDRVVSDSCDDGYTR